VVFDHIIYLFLDYFLTRLLACALRNILHKPARLRPQQPPAIQPSKFHSKLNLNNKIKLTFFLDFDKFAKRINCYFCNFCKSNLHKSIRLRRQKHFNANLLACAHSNHLPSIQSTNFMVIKIKTTKFTWWSSAAMIYFLTCKFAKHIVIFIIFQKHSTQTCSPAHEATAFHAVNKFHGKQN